MTVGEWLAHRAPAPPDMLAERIVSAVGDAASRPAAEATEVCLVAAEQVVGELLRGECASRDSALDLLTADALVTYAFEAAAESPAAIAETASAAMARIATLAGSRAERAIA